MGLRRVSRIAHAFALAQVILAGMTGKAFAWGHWLYKDPSVGYAVPIQTVYQFPAALVSQPTRTTGYAAPIQTVYQFPAAIVNQPGTYGPFAAPGWVGGYAPGLRPFPR
jgi:hypothetical protein